MTPLVFLAPLVRRGAEGRKRRPPGQSEPMSPSKPSARSEVEPFLVMEVMRAAIDREHAGDRVIHMEVGQPGAPAPQAVLEPARAALAKGHFGYTEALGRRELRARIARYYADAH